MIEETIKLLGQRATDKVTGLSGVVTSVCFDLYGCVQAALTPPAVDNEQKSQGSWFDVNRLEMGNEQVMEVPDFAARATTPAKYQHGAAEKLMPTQ